MPEALVALANRHRFEPGAVLDNGPVRSVMQLWCHGGRGECTVDGMRFELAPGDLLLLPFGHRVAYRAGRRSSWLVAGVHVLPRCRPPPGEAPPFWRVPHRPDSPLAAAAWITDDPGIVLPAPRSFRVPADHPVLLLGDYAVACFRARRIDEAAMRPLAGLLIAHWQELLATPPHAPLPEALRRIDEELDHRPDLAPSLARCASIAGVSRATLKRLARRHWDDSVHHHIRARQLARACERLRGSALPIARIAVDCGFADPLYFSRVFRRATGLSPRAWRQRYGRL